MRGFSVKRLSVAVLKLERGAETEGNVVAVILTEFVSGVRCAERVAGGEGDVLVEGEIKSNARRNDIFVIGGVTFGSCTTEFIMDVVETNGGVQAICQTALCGDTDSVAGAVLIASDIRIFIAVTSIAVEGGFLVGMVAQVCLDVWVCVCTTIVAVTELSTCTEPTESAAGEVVIQTSEDVMGCVVTKSTTIVVGHGEAVVESSGGQLAQGITELLVNHVCEVVFTIGGIFLVIDTGDGVTSHSGEFAAPCVGDGQIVVAVEILLSATAGSCSDLVIWFKLVSKIQSIRNGSLRAELVAEAQVQTSGAHVVVRSRRRIQVVEPRIGKGCTVVGAAISTTILTCHTSCQVGTVNFVFGTQIHVRIITCTDINSDGQGEATLEFILVRTKADQALSEGGSTSGQRGDGNE